MAGYWNYTSKRLEYCAGGKMPFGRNRPVEPRAGRVAAAGPLVRPLVPSAAAARTARREGPALPLDLSRLSRVRQSDALRKPAR